MSTPGDAQSQWDPNTATMPPKPRNGLGTTALVFGVLAILTCWLPVVGFVLGVVAIITGAIGRSRVKKLQANNGGVATTGLVLGIVSVILNIIATLLIGGLALAFFGIGGGQVASQYSQCIANAPNAGTPAQVQQAFEECQNQLGSQLPQTGGDEQGGG